jgi:putative transposase
MHHINDILTHPKRTEIETRLKIIDFFDEYGAKATRQAFGKSRSTLFLWKQKLTKANGKLSALAPGNKTPICKRKRVVHPYYY